MVEFFKYPSIPRLYREWVVTEKIDGTNAQVLILPLDELDSADVGLDRQMVAEANGFALYAGSRNRWLTVDVDNFGFAQYVADCAFELVQLGRGRFYGEWWGAGIQRGYGVAEKRFTLFSTPKTGIVPLCISGVVPVLGVVSHDEIADLLIDLEQTGSKVAPGYMLPEGIVAKHSKSGHLYKATLFDDDGKWSKG
jgi:hypothetical protein